jgi:hypothetical protein
MALGGLLADPFGGKLKSLDTPKMKVLGGVMKGLSKIKTGTAKHLSKAFGKLKGFGIQAALSGIMGFIEKMGVLDPLFEVLGGLIEFFGGQLLSLLMPSFEKLFEVLLSEENLTLLSESAVLWAKMLIPLIELAVVVLPPLIVGMNYLVTALNMFGDPILMILFLISPITAAMYLWAHAIQWLGGLLSWIAGPVGHLGAGLSWLGGMIISIVNIIKNAINSIPVIGGGGGGGLFGWGFMGLQHGIDRVPQTGPYILHEGEKVTSAAENVGGGNDQMLAQQELTNSLLEALINMKGRKKIQRRRQ